jgi:hypothetical protein
MIWPSPARQSSAHAYDETVPKRFNCRLESRMRENRLYGSEGGVAKAIPTPIRFCARAHANLRSGRENARGASRTSEWGLSQPACGNGNIADEATVARWETFLDEAICVLIKIVAR